MRRAIYPGTFDPVTYGHLDVIKRAAELVDELLVAVLYNANKTPLFTVDERIAMLEDVTKDIENVKVITFSGLQAELAHKEQAFLIHGLRSGADFEYELQIAQASRTVFPDIDTVFMTASPEFAFLSSSIVRETARHHGDISKFVPDSVGRLVKEKINCKAENTK